MRPSFSCLMSCYHKDSPSYLKEAFGSLVGQTVQADEIVFVEDGKLSVELYQVIEDFQAILPINVIKIEENKGLGNALRVGLQACANDIVVRMDTDDICAPKRFEKQVSFMENHPEVSIVGTWAYDIDDAGEITGERVFPTEHEELLNIIWACPFAHPTVAFRKQAILGIGSYRSDIKRRQDYDLWLRAAAKGLKFANIPEHLLYYRFTDAYYKKNDIKVAWAQAMMGAKGLSALNVRKLYPYIGVFSPVVRALLPSFVAKHIHRLFQKVDPRRQHAKRPTSYTR